MNNEENTKLFYERIEIILWFLLGVSVIAYTFANWANSEWETLILRLSTILILSVLLMKIVKHARLKNSLRIVIYTVVFIIFLSLVLLPISF